MSIIHKDRGPIFQQAQFLLSASQLDQLPADFGKEVAFIGRSNVGKSSLLNALCQQKKLAKISKTPGRTRLLNVFQLNEDTRFIDLPGYGYAAVSQAMKQRWQATLNDYLHTRQSLAALILILDIRREWSEEDLLLKHWAESLRLPLFIVLNKADKFSFGRAKQVVLGHQKKWPLADTSTLHLCSAETGMGIEGLQGALQKMFCDHSENLCS